MKRKSNISSKEESYYKMERIQELLNLVGEPRLKNEYLSMEKGYLTRIWFNIDQNKWLTGYFCFEEGKYRWSSFRSTTEETVFDLAKKFLRYNHPAESIPNLEYKFIHNPTLKVQVLPDCVIIHNHEGARLALGKEMAFWYHEGHGQSWFEGDLFDCPEDMFGSINQIPYSFEGVVEILNKKISP